MYINSCMLVYVRLRSMYIASGTWASDTAGLVLIGMVPNKCFS